MIVLKPVDRVEVLSIMDNSIDVLMGNTPVARRADSALTSTQHPTEPRVAEQSVCEALTGQSLIH